MKKLYLIFLFLIPFMVNGQHYIKEYEYNASENDSKIKSRHYAISELRKQVVDEVGVLINTQTNVTNNNGKYNYQENTIIISESITETKILDEKWNGETYYIKVDIYVDKKQLNERLKNKVVQNVIITHNYENKNNNEYLINPIKKEKNYYIYGDFHTKYHKNYNMMSSGICFGYVSNNIFDIGIYGLTSFNKDIKYINTGINLGFYIFNKNIILKIPLRIGSGNINNNFFGTIEPGLECGLKIKNISLTSGISYILTDNINYSDLISGYNLYFKITYKRDIYR
jgi:hypothetical protein